MKKNGSFTVTIPFKFQQDFAVWAKSLNCNLQAKQKTTKPKLENIPEYRKPLVWSKFEIH